MNQENNLTINDLNSYKSAIEDIIDYSNDAVESFLHIGRLFLYVKLNELYKLEDYVDIYDFALDKFGYKKTSVKNFINVFEKYSNYDPEKSVDLNNKWNFDLKEEFEGYNFTKLVELLPVPIDEIKSNYDKDLSVKEIRETKLIGQLTDQLKVSVNRYKEIIELLKQEFDLINTNLGDKYFKYKQKSNKIDLDEVYLSDEFCFSFVSFYVNFDGKNFKINFNNYDLLSITDEYISLIADEWFKKELSRIKLYIEREKKDKEEKKIKKEEKQKIDRLPYKVIDHWDLESSNLFVYSMIVYLEYVILKSDKSIYDLKIFKYKDKPLFEYPIIYNNAEVGSFLYNTETEETCFKFDKLNIESNNSLDKEHDLIYWTIDKDYKRCDLFSYKTLQHIVRHSDFEEIDEEEENVD